MDDFEFNSFKSKVNLDFYSLTGFLFWSDVIHETWTVILFCTHSILFSSSHGNESPSIPFVIVFAMFAMLIYKGPSSNLNLIHSLTQQILLRVQ